MSRLNTTGGGFGGPRVVKPQANVYTVLLVIATLCVAAALVWEWMYIMPGLKDPPQHNAAQSAARAVEVAPTQVASRPTIELIG